MDQTTPNVSEETVVENTTPTLVENPNAKWYVVHTYSGHENKVEATLRQRIVMNHLQDKFVDIKVPTHDQVQIKEGKKSTIKEKIFPGYILIKMELNDDSWSLVRTTQGVTSFVGMGNKPTALPEKEVQTIMKFMEVAAPRYKNRFETNEAVKIVDGPFADFVGSISEINDEKGKVTVLVSIFGRETPVELDFLQIAKL
jgi:transcriptional antiterminator NusG